MSVVIGNRTFNNDTIFVKLSYNALRSIPIEIGNLLNLQHLYLENNQLTSLPVEIGNLVNLHTLYLSSNQLTILPIEIGNLVNLKKLWLSNNKLKSLPTEILNIIKILVINDTSYQIYNIPNNTEFLIFNNLRNNLDNLPLTLKTLYLHKNIDLTKHTIKLPFSCVIERY